MNEINVKAILLGNTNVGKTSILGRIMDNYIENPQQTIGAVYSIKNLKYENKDITMEIWDTAGQEKYHCLAPIYYHNTDIVFLVYSIDDNESFSIIDFWVNSLNDSSQTPDLIFLIANKIDLTVNVPRQKGIEKAENIGAIYYEVSAKTGNGVSDLLNTVAQMYIEKLNNGLIVNKKNKIQKSKSCC